MTLERCDILARQCIGHQLRREKRAEAAKQAEIACLLLSMVDEDEQERIERAATALARAKRLCRDVLRGKA